MVGETISIAVTGAAGQIGYSLLPEILQEDGVFGYEDIVDLRLLEVPQAMPKLEGVALEVEDLASPLLGNLMITDNPRAAFDGVDFVFMVGSRPRQPDMDRADLLQVNAPIFVEQGRALNDVAAEEVGVLVVGNPANSNALVALSNAPDIPATSFTAMSRLDHNRAVSMVASKLNVNPGDIDDLTIWGNHSDTMVVDVTRATVIDKGSVLELLDEPDWVKTLQRDVANRGKVVMGARGASSAMSAARAAVDQAGDYLYGGRGNRHSAAVYSLGEYGTPEGVVFSFPIEATSDIGLTVVEGLELPKEIRDGLVRTGEELVEERDALRAMGFLAVERI